MRQARRKAIETAQKAKQFGLILGTLGRQGNPRILDHLQGIMQHKGISFTVVCSSFVQFLFVPLDFIRCDACNSDLQKLVSTFPSHALMIRYAMSRLLILFSLKCTSRSSGKGRLTARCSLSSAAVLVFPVFQSTHTHYAHAVEDVERELLSTSSTDRCTLKAMPAAQKVVGQEKAR